MKKLFTAGALAGSLLLANCSTLSTVTPTSVSAEVTAILTSVDRYVATACSAIPELTSLIALANAGVAVSVTALGGAFCSAFQSAVPATPPASARKRLGRKFGAGTGGLQYYCAGQICGWK
jgi:hypothetical protein